MKSSAPIAEQVCPACGMPIGVAVKCVVKQGRCWHMADACYEMLEMPLDPDTGLVEGLSTCDNCNKVWHTPAELRACIESMVKPAEKEDDSELVEWYCEPCNTYFFAGDDATCEHRESVQVVT